MADSTYKGDSPGKALIRIRAWSAIRMTMGALGVPFQGAMVLAGEGGDLGVLDGMGFPLNKVVAVDRDPFYVDWCKHEYPDVIPAKGELMDVAASGILPYNTAHIDLCGGVRLVDNILTVARVARGIHTHPSVFAVTMLKGRERKAANGLMDGVYRGTRRRLQLAARKKGDVLAEHIYSGKKWDSNRMRKWVEEKIRREAARDPNSAVGMFKKNGKFTSLGMGMVRSILLHHTIEYLWEAWDAQGSSSLPPGERLHIQQAGCLVYHSGNTAEGKDGMPFVTCLYLVYRSSQMHWIRDWVMRQVAHCERTGRTERGVFPYRSVSLKDSLEGFNPTVAAMARVQDHDKVARMFGIDPKSIPAILAHDTRGSYKAKPLWSHSKVLLPAGQHDPSWGEPVTPQDIQRAQRLIRADKTLDQRLSEWIANGGTVETFPGLSEIDISLTPAGGGA